jgi:GDP/GTP exchange factor required for growth at low temperature
MLTAGMLRPRAPPPGDAPPSVTVSTSETPPRSSKSRLRLRYSRSNPTLRTQSTSIPSILPDEKGFYRPDSVQFDQPETARDSRIRASSVPVELGPSLGGPSSEYREDDVLGRLLGWSSHPPVSRGSRHFKLSSGSAPGRLPGRSSLSRDSKSLGNQDKELPADLVAELPAERAASPRSSNERPRLRRQKNMRLPPVDTSVTPPAGRHQLSPFGDGVRLAYVDKAMLGENNHRSPPGTPSSVRVREALSSESMRTEKPNDDDEVPARFSDPTIFDVLQSFENTHPPSPNSRQSFHFTHERVASTSSNASSHSSQATAHQITVFTAPGDDPRFVLWGHKRTDSVSHRRAISGDGDIPSPPSTSPSTKRRSLRKGSVDLGSSTPHSPGSGGKRNSLVSSTPPSRVLMAATIERWIAELTSKLDSDLLTDFFLTYRSFLSPLCLLSLLITRFEWALATPTSPEDEAGRRIVRVRTYVVIRHWLLNYFVEDFVPERKLRMKLTTWLNAVSRHPKAKSNTSDHQLLKNLKKLVRRFKKSYSSKMNGQAETNPLNARSSMAMSEAPSTVPRNSDATESEVDVNIDLSSSTLMIFVLTMIC